MVQDNGASAGAPTVDPPLRPSGGGVSVPLGTAPQRNPRATWHTRANAVVLAYLAACILAVVARDALPVPRWLAAHLFLLGAVTNAIVTWSEHFATTLLRAPAASRRQVGLRLVGLNVGILAVLAAVATDHPVLTTAGAGVVAAVIGVHLAGLVRLGRRALQTRFGAITRFYVAAGVFLLAGIVFGTLLATGHARGVWDGRLHAAHVHTNVLGWVALTVLGTEFTLWPTALRTRMVEGTKDAAHRTLALTVVGLTATIAALLAGSTLGAAAGLVLYAAGLVTALIPLVRTARPAAPAHRRDLAAGRGHHLAGGRRGGGRGDHAPSAGRGSGCRPARPVGAGAAGGLRRPGAHRRAHLPAAGGARPRTRRRPAGHSHAGAGMAPAHRRG